MNENVNKPEQDYTQIGNPFSNISGPLSDQDPPESDDSPYEETHEPHLPPPSESPQQPAWQTSPAPAGDSRAIDTSSPSSSGNTATTLLLSTRNEFIRGIIFNALFNVVTVLFLFFLFFLVAHAHVHASLDFNGPYRGVYLILFFVPTLFYVMSMCIYVLDFIRKRTLCLKGVTVEGYITGHRSSSSKGTYYYLEYNYRYNGKVYTQEDSVKEHYYRTLHDGDSVQVRCLPNKPTTARLLDSELNRFFG